MEDKVKEIVKMSTRDVVEVANQMTDPDQYLDDMFNSSIYNDNNVIILTKDKYDILDKKYLSENNLKNKCQKCRRKKIEKNNK